MIKDILTRQIADIKSQNQSGKIGGNFDMTAETENVENETCTTIRVKSPLVVAIDAVIKSAQGKALAVYAQALKETAVSYAYQLTTDTSYGNDAEKKTVLNVAGKLAEMSGKGSELTNDYRIMYTTTDGETTTKKAETFDEITRAFRNSRMAIADAKRRAKEEAERIQKEKEEQKRALLAKLAEYIPAELRKQVVELGLI